MEDVELFEATKQTVVAGLARKAGVSESSVEVAFSEGSVKVDASIQIPPELAKDAAAIMAELTKPSNGSELLQSLAAQPKFNELKEDPRKDFTVSWVGNNYSVYRKIKLELQIPEGSKYRNNKISQADFTGLVLGGIEANVCK